MGCSSNPQLVFSLQAVEDGVLAQDRLCLMDIGVRDGVQKKWRPLKDGIAFWGFDPDEAECARLSGILSSLDYDFFLSTKLVHQTTGKVRFHQTHSPYACGILPYNPTFSGRLGELCDLNLEVVAKSMLDAVSLDDFCAQEKTRPMNFIKIDTEGSEHMILQGAKTLLKSRELLGIEAEFWTGPIKSAENLGAIHNLMVSSGFYLFDLEFARYPRRTFPHGFIDVNPSTGESTLQSPQRFGQIMTGDVVYLRDPVWELSQGIDRFDWIDSNVVKMAILYEMFQLWDCAIELLQTYHTRFESRLNFELYQNLLTPSTGSTDTPANYQQYVQKSLELRYPSLVR